MGPLAGEEWRTPLQRRRALSWARVGPQPERVAFYPWRAVRSLGPIIGTGRRSGQLNTDFREPLFLTEVWPGLARFGQVFRGSSLNVRLRVSFTRGKSNTEVRHEATAVWIFGQMQNPGEVALVGFMATDIDHSRAPKPVLEELNNEFA